LIEFGSIVTANADAPRATANAVVPGRGEAARAGIAPRESVRKNAPIRLFTRLG